MTDQLRFAIMATGGIAHGVAPRIHEADGCAVTFAASRSADKARAFADQQGYPDAGTYDDLLTSDAFDAVYQASTTDTHPEWTLKLLEAGKHVLCEKPLCWTRSDAEKLFAAAKANGVVLAEAFMTLQSRPLREVARIVQSPASPIGVMKKIEARFEVPLAIEPPTTNTRFSKKLGGGALLDLGCYCLLFGRTVTGREPEFGHAEAVMADWFHTSEGDDAVDRRIEASGNLGDIAYEISCDLGAADRRVFARITGEKGVIDVPHFPSAYTHEVKEPGAAEPETPESWPDNGHLYRDQAASFAKKIRGEQSDTPVPGADWSINQAAAIERVFALGGQDWPPAL